MIWCRPHSICTTLSQFQTHAFQIFILQRTKTPYAICIEQQKKTGKIKERRERANVNKNRKTSFSNRIPKYYAQSKYLHWVFKKLADNADACRKNKQATVLYIYGNEFIESNLLFWMGMVCMFVHAHVLKTLKFWWFHWNRKPHKYSRNFVELEWHLWEYPIQTKTTVTRSKDNFQVLFCVVQSNAE